MAGQVGSHNPDDQLVPCGEAAGVDVEVEVGDVVPLPARPGRQGQFRFTVHAEQFDSVASE